jgi:autotransporter-associated beta strand protein
VIAGGGTVDLAAENTFKGGITIDSGVLQLAKRSSRRRGRNRLCDRGRRTPLRRRRKPREYD